jgi:hypothetical protein
MSAREDKLFFRAYMKLHLLVYCETWWNSESEENLGKFFVLHHGIHHFQSFKDLRRQAMYVSWLLYRGLQHDNACYSFPIYYGVIKSRKIRWLDMWSIWNRNKSRVFGGSPKKIIYFEDLGLDLRIRLKYNLKRRRAGEHELVYLA